MKLALEKAEQATSKFKELQSSAAKAREHIAEEDSKAAPERNLEAKLAPKTDGSNLHTPVKKNGQSENPSKQSPSSKQERTAASLAPKTGQIQKQRSSEGENIHQDESDQDMQDANQEPDENKKSGSSGQDGPREEPNEFKDQRPVIIVEPNLDLGAFASGTESESGAEDTYMADDAPSQSP